MKKSLFIICCICIVTEAIAQKCPEGFHKAMYRGEVTLIRPDNDIIKPAADFYACVSDKASATGLEVFWSVKALFHNYKYIKFTKRIELTCGKVITEDVELDGMKKDEVRVGGSFAGEMQLSNNFYNDACNGQKVGIKSLDVENITAELYDDDILSPQWNRKQNEIRKELTEKFNNKLTAARTALDTIKNNNPDKAANYENTHGAVISQMKNNFQDEVNKGSKADQQKLQGYMTSLENETAQLAEISEANPGKKNTSLVTQNTNLGNNQPKNNSQQNNITNSNNGNNSNDTNNSQKQQYQQQVNEYLNKAQDTSTSAITQQMNLDLAKTNAVMTGNQQQLQQIQQLQNQKNKTAGEESIKNLTTSVINLFTSILNQKERRKELVEGAKNYERNKLTLEYLNNYNELYSKNYISYDVIHSTTGSDINYTETKQNEESRIDSIISFISSENYCDALISKQDYIVPGIMQNFRLDALRQSETRIKGGGVMYRQSYNFYKYDFLSFLIDANPYFNPYNVDLEKKQLRNIQKKAEQGEAYSQWVIGINGFYNSEDLPTIKNGLEKTLNNTNAKNLWKKESYYCFGLINLYQGVLNKDSSLLNKSLYYLDSAYKINYSSSSNLSSYQFTGDWLSSSTFAGFQIDILYAILQCNAELKIMTGNISYCKRAIQYYLNYPDQANKDNYIDINIKLE